MPDTYRGELVPRDAVVTTNQDSLWMVGHPEVDRLGHESLDVTLAYLNGKDAESEEAQEYANSSSLALYA